MERLNALDAEFLHLEDEFVHLHIGGACVFDGPPPPSGAFEALVLSKLHLIPDTGGLCARCRSSWADRSGWMTHVLTLVITSGTRRCPRPATTPPSAT